MDWKLFLFLVACSLMFISICLIVSIRTYRSKKNKPVAYAWEAVTRVMSAAEKDKLPKYVGRVTTLEHRRDNLVVCIALVTERISSIFSPRPEHKHLLDEWMPVLHHLNAEKYLLDRDIDKLVD